MSRKQLDTIARLGNARHVAAVRYRSRLTPAHTVERIVEPYDIVQGKEDILVRCYQLWPQEGWRCFMSHKIDSVRDTGEPFEPRREISMAGTEGHTLFGTDRVREPWTEPMLHYRDLVADALADGIVNKDEFDRIRAFAQGERAEGGAGLTREQARYVHVYLYHRALGAVLRDGTVGPAQLAEIRMVQRVLAGLGWSPTGATPPRRDPVPGRDAAPQPTQPNFTGPPQAEVEPWG